MNAKGDSILDKIKPISVKPFCTQLDNRKQKGELHLEKSSKKKTSKKKHGKKSRSRKKKKRKKQKNKDKKKKKKRKRKKRRQKKKKEEKRKKPKRYKSGDYEMDNFTEMEKPHGPKTETEEKRHIIEYVF